MGVLDRIQEAALGNGDAAKHRSMQEQLNSATITNELLRESMQRLEMALEEEGWRSVSGELDAEFSRDGLDMLVDLSRAMYIANPLINRAVNVTGYYVWAQGVTIQAADERVQQLVIDPLLEDYTNQEELFGTQARLLTEVDQMVDGNVFLGLPTNEATGEVYVRSIPSNEIREIITKPGDKAVVMFYRRDWVEKVLDETTGRVEAKTRSALYPDWRYFPVDRPEQMGEMEVLWSSPVIHRKSGGLKQMRFGVPEVYSAIPWARAYKGFLEDWHTIAKSLARFAWQGVVASKGKGGGKVKRTKDKLQRPTIEEYEEGSSKRTPPEQAGAVWLGGEGDSLTPIPKTGATMRADDSRPSRLMVATAMNLPDTILSGDVDVGNFATSKTLDRPTELYMRTRQALNVDLLQCVFQYAFMAQVRYGIMPGGERESGGYLEIESNIDDTIAITFPPILEDDKKANVDAVVAAATLSGHPDAGVLPQEYTAKALLESLGAEDIEGILKELPEEQNEELQEAVNALREALRGNS
jgi:hypothetical protein